MFLDASALCSMICGEDDAPFLAAKLRTAELSLTSPLAIWEAVANVSRILAIDDEHAQRLVEQFIAEFTIVTTAIEPAMTSLALDGRRRFGKGRHPAALNFGDCFAYACARHHNVPLLSKRIEFSLTDIDAA